jgi:chemotaxis protein MotB
MKRKKEAEKDNAERWLLSYADFITLLMIFFIIMYSMSVVDAQKYKQLSSSLNSALAGDNQKIEGGDQGSPVEDVKLNDPEANATQEDMAKLMEQVNQLINEKGLQNEVTVNMGEIGVWITFKDFVLFDSGSATIKPEMVGTLVELGKILTTVNNYVRVEGYTDNVPISTSTFSNNWDLSVMRASKVLEIVVSQAGFPPDKISAIGYGEYRPVAPNDTDENKAKNRRVDIVILKTTFNATEKSQ